MDDFHKQSLLHCRMSDIETALYLVPVEVIISMSDKDFKEFIALRSRFTKLTNRLWRELITPKK